MDAGILAMYPVTELCEEHVANKDILSAIQRHKINGALFLNLEKEQMVELSPIIGDRMVVKTIPQGGQK